jgi:hypothetical protein
MPDAWHQHSNGRMLFGDDTGGSTLAGVACHWQHGDERDAALAQAEQLMAVGAAMRRAFAPDLAAAVRLGALVPAICPACGLVPRSTTRTTSCGTGAARGTQSAGPTPTPVPRSTTMADVVICSIGTPLDLVLPDAGQGLCCEGAAYLGPDRCTCWVEVHAVDQADPRTDQHAGIGESPCSTCAYRPDSPERTGADHVAGDAAMLDDIVKTGQPFWCHTGMRHVVALEHPAGIRVELPDEHQAAAFRPLIVNDVPYKADGTPADICAGWAARRLRHMQG